MFVAVRCCYYTSGITFFFFFPPKELHMYACACVQIHTHTHTNNTSFSYCSNNSHCESIGIRNWGSVSMRKIFVKYVQMGVAVA